MSDFGCHATAVVVGEPHAANRFMSEWFTPRPLSGAESGSGPAPVKEDGKANPTESPVISDLGVALQTF
jgi:hypothetical protein